MIPTDSRRRWFDGRLASAARVVEWGFNRLIDGAIWAERLKQLTFGLRSNKPIEGTSMADFVAAIRAQN